MLLKLVHCLTEGYFKQLGECNFEAEQILFFFFNIFVRLVMCNNDN